MIANLNMNLAKNPQEREEIAREIALLEMKKIEIMKNPNILGNYRVRTQQSMSKWEIDRRLSDSFMTDLNRSIPSSVLHSQ